MTNAEQLALWADKLRDIAAMGGNFARNIYDKENYEQIQRIALEMMALATGESVVELEPLLATVFKAPTPFSVGDAAVVDEAGRLLLIRRADNKLWAMPGGALEVGETPAEGVVREAYEETGVQCKVVALVGIYDSRYRNSVTAHHLYQYVFLCEPLNGGKVVNPPSHLLEVLDTAWFAEAELPTDLDPAHVKSIADAFAMWRGNTAVYFDNPI